MFGLIVQKRLRLRNSIFRSIVPRIAPFSQFRTFGLLYRVIVKKLFLEKVVARKEVGSRSIAIAMNQQRRPTGEKVRE